MLIARHFTFLFLFTDVVLTIHTSVSSLSLPELSIFCLILKIRFVRSKKLAETSELGLGCPRNNQSFFWFKPKQTETQSVLVVFQFVSRNQKTFFSVCFGVLDWYRNNQNKQNFLETNRKNLQKMFYIRGSSKPLIFFLGSNRNKPKLDMFWLFFGLILCETPNFFFQFVSVCFDVLDQYRNNRNKQNLWYGELKMLIF